MRIIFLLLVCAGTAEFGFAQFPEIPPSTLAAPNLAFDDGQDAMRTRLFRTTTSRAQIDLGGWWDFVPDPGDKGEKLNYSSRLPRPETRLWVPGTWNSVARYWNYLGPAWYQRDFEVAGGGNLRITFGSVFYRSKIWLDGKLLGEHEGGYLPFAFTARDVKKGPHTLVVRVDNRLDDQSLPKQNVDWFPYGGIERPVYAEMVPSVFIDSFHVISSSIQPSRASLKVRVFLWNLGQSSAAVELAFSVNGTRMHVARHTAASGKSAAEFEVVLQRPRLWSVEEPNLYSARISLNGEKDDQFTRLGVREIRADGPRILLNGRPLKVAGVNRHEDHPDWGSSSPPNLLRQDIEIIKRLGANAVRAHYSLPELFMDFCDQYGLLFMAEAPAWQCSSEQLAKPEIQEKILRHFEEMVARDRNHPSVFTWSLGNEWPQPDRSYDVIRELIKRARRFDPTRLITLVTGGPHVRRIHELVDVICVNWARYQWYDPFTTLNSEEGAKSVADLAKIHERYPAKPVILTEFGGSEAQAGWHNWGNVKWSEEYQARNVEDSASHALQQDWISGGCVWQFCDSRSAPERFLAGRLHGWNGKGIVDANRNPKLAFYKLQQIFRATAEPPSTNGGTLSSDAGK